MVPYLILSLQYQFWNVFPPCPPSLLYYVSLLDILYVPYQYHYLNLELIFHVRGKFHKILHLFGRCWHNRVFLIILYQLNLIISFSTGFQCLVCSWKPVSSLNMTIIFIISVTFILNFGIISFIFLYFRFDF